jgi:hypothetical protein
MRARTIRFAGCRIGERTAQAVREKLEALITI